MTWSSDRIPGPDFGLLRSRGRGAGLGFARLPAREPAGRGRRRGPGGRGGTRRRAAVRAGGGAARAGGGAARSRRRDYCGRRRRSGGSWRRDHCGRRRRRRGGGHRRARRRRARVWRDAGDRPEAAPAAPRGSRRPPRAPPGRSCPWMRQRVVGPVGRRLADLSLVEPAAANGLDHAAVLQVHHLAQRLLVHAVAADEVPVGALLRHQDLAAHVDERLHHGIREAAILRLHVKHLRFVLHVRVEAGDHGGGKF